MHGRFSRSAGKVCEGLTGVLRAVGDAGPYMVDEGRASENRVRIEAVTGAEVDDPRKTAPTTARKKRTRRQFSKFLPMCAREGAASCGPALTEAERIPREFLETACSDRPAAPPQARKFFPAPCSAGKFRPRKLPRKFRSLVREIRRGWHGSGAAGGRASRAGRRPEAARSGGEAGRSGRGGARAGHNGRSRARQGAEIPGDGRGGLVRLARYKAGGDPRRA